MNAAMRTRSIGGANQKEETLRRKPLPAIAIVAISNVKMLFHCIIDSMQISS